MRDGSTRYWTKIIGSQLIICTPFFINLNFSNALAPRYVIINAFFLIHRS